MKLFRFRWRKPQTIHFSGLLVEDIQISKEVAGHVQLTITLEPAEGERRQAPIQLVMPSGLAFTLAGRIRKRLGLSPEELARGLRIATWQGMDDR